MRIVITESNKRAGEYDLRTENGDYAVVLLGSSKDLARTAREWGYGETSAWLSGMKGKAAWLEAIEVEKKSRGTGTVLLEAVLSFLLSRRVGFIFAHAYAEPGQHEALARWYSRRGFVLLGVLDGMPFYFREIGER
jgi:hypothetical protein